MFQPVHGFAIKSFGDGDVGEGGGGGGAVPVALGGRKPDDVAGANLLDGGAIALDPSAAGGDDERLAEWVGVPCGARAGLEGDAGGAEERGVLGLDERVDADGAGEPIGGAADGGDGTGALDVHGVLLMPYCVLSKRAA